MTSLRWPAYVIASLLLIIIGSACVRGDETAAGAASTGRIPRATITVIDVLGRTVEVRSPSERVILGEGRQVHLMAALDTGNPARRIVGWRKDFVESDADTYAEYLKAFPKLAKIPIVGSFGDQTFDVEQAIALRPDVIFMDIDARRAINDARYIEKLSAVEIPVVYVDFRHYPLKNTEPTIRLFGRILGKEARAEELIAFRSEQIRRVTDVIHANQPVRPKVFIERTAGISNDCCMSFGNENLGKFVEIAGGSNIGVGLISGTFGQLSAQQVAAADPEHIVLTSANRGAYLPGQGWIALGPGADLHEAQNKLEAYSRQPMFRNVRATQTQSFHAIWHQFYHSPFQFLAVQQLAKWFHPTLFLDLDPEATLRELHERFLPIKHQAGHFVSLQTRAEGM